MCYSWVKEKISNLLPHNLGYTAIGAALLWFGWFGFNAGSALTAGGLAGSAFIVTNTATAAALISWIIMDVLKTGKPTLLGGLSGAIAGLVAITPAAGFVTSSRGNSNRFHGLNILILCNIHY